jgi:hypothetical protein
MDIETAKLIVTTFEEVHRQIFALHDELRGRCGPEEFALLQREIARVSGVIDGNLYPLVLRQYPELDPLQGRG